MGPGVTSQTHSRTVYSDNKQKHQLVLRRTSRCFVFLCPCLVFTKYFARLIKIYQEQTITYMGPDMTSQKPSRTFCDDNKEKHQLVLRRTSWCFEFLSPSHVFTKYFARLIKVHKEQTITCMGPVVTSQTLLEPFILITGKSTSWCFNAPAGAFCF